jgi:hypothetical protein
MRKYLPALSSEDSFPSSHLSGLGRRKPGGGGPEGVADRRAVVEKAATRVAAGVNGRRDVESAAAGRLRATSVVKGLADAIVWLLVAEWVKG